MITMTLSLSTIVVVLNTWRARVCCESCLHHIFQNDLWGHRFWFLLIREKAKSDRSTFGGDQSLHFPLLRIKPHCAVDHWGGAHDHPLLHQNPTFLIEFTLSRMTCGQLNWMRDKRN